VLGSIILLGVMSWELPLGQQPLSGLSSPLADVGSFVRRNHQRA